MTLAVRASRQTWRRHSSVSTASAGLAAASPSFPRQLYRKFCSDLFRRSFRCFWFALFMSATPQRVCAKLNGAALCNSCDKTQVQRA